MEFNVCIRKETIDLVPPVKKEPMDEPAMAQQLLKTKEKLPLDDEESETSFADLDNMPRDWFSGASSDSEEATDDASVAISNVSVFHFPIKREPLPAEEESLTTFASPQPASPSIIIKGETCPCTGDCLDCQSKRSHPCPECGKTFSSNAYLKIHQRVHTGERPYTCAQCPSAFSKLGHLKQHQVTHQTVRSRPFRCTAEGCRKAFPRKGCLTVHLRSHTGEKPYTCGNCGKSFTTGSNLTVHLRRHTAVKPHKCDNCGKGFTTIFELTLHHRSHTGERPYRCPLCPKAFASSSNAKSHQRTVHSRSP